uniref:Ubiquitin-like domain-containing protein n=1 Tax=Araucaria cunninghamii TaxID=56994 RepID=A0A0D6QTZ9_ARACU
MEMTSSVISEDFVPGRRLVVHVAENGHSFEIDCEPRTSVEAVQQSLASMAGVSVSDQLLICGETKLESQRSLGSYKLPCDGHDVFLYNRVRLMADCPPPPPEDIELPEVSVPQIPSTSQNPHPLDDAADPAVKALGAYERQFKYHFHKAHAIYIGSQTRIDLSNRLLQEQQVQGKALETARANLEHCYKMIHQMYVEFMKQFDQQHRYHGDLISNFQKTIDRLRVIKLHPNLQTERYKCLLDFVREEYRSPKCLEACIASHEQFEAKVSQFKSVYAELQGRVDDLFHAQSSVNVRHVEDMIRKQKQIFQDQIIILQALGKDVNTVKKLVEECLSSRISASSVRPHDAVSALGQYYEVHDKNYLPRMEARIRDVSKLFESCKAKKHEMSMCIHTSMQKVASLQFSIRDVRYQLLAFKEAMQRQDGIFSKLKVVRKIGSAYRACLAEVVRRKAFLKLYMGQAGQLAEKLASRRELERCRRREFLNLQSEYIPQDVLEALGLFDTPSQCIVNLAPFDSSLLDIDVADLECYAPESLVGLLPKGDQNAQGKGLLSTSNSSYQSGNGYESSVSTQKQYETGMTDEECDSEPILGTTEMEVENAWLKAEFASAVAFISSFAPDVYYDSVDESSMEGLLQKATEKTAQALHLKDEYVKHVENDLKVKQVQCSRYEKRIQELEQRLSDQFIHISKLSDRKNGLECPVSSVPAVKTDDCKSETSVLTADGMAPLVSPEPMDEGTCTSTDYMSASKTEHLNGQSSKFQESVDENMADLVGAMVPEAISTGTVPLGTSVLEISKDDSQDAARENTQQVESAAQLKTISVDSNMTHATEKINSALEHKEGRFLEIENALLEKTRECAAIETRLATVLEDFASVKRELEVSLKLLDESQMNCAHLENLLHEAREEAQTNLCAADRKAAEYNGLRASSVKLRALLERLRSCVASPSGGTTGFAESLRSLALSLGSSAANETGEDGCSEFRVCIKILAEKVGILAQQRADLMERCTRAEAAQNHLSKELESNTELVKILHAKHKMEKQVNKEKISFTRFVVHELAAFVPNAAGHYEAINRNCRNYFLSEESIALFADRPNGRHYIIGQIVHMERNIARHPDRECLVASGSSSSSARSRFNPYGLPIGTEYFVVTVAMVPDTIHS